VLTRQAAAAVSVWERIGRGNLLLGCGRLGGARRRGAGAYYGGRPSTAC